PFEIGRKLSAHLLTDLASRGAHPRLLQVTVGARQETPEPFLVELESGVTSAAKKFRFQTQFAPTVPSPATIVLQMTGVGAREVERFAQKGPATGDAICVTGYLGEAMAAMNALSKLGRAGFSQELNLLEAYLNPTPPVALLPALTRS